MDMEMFKQMFSQYCHNSIRTTDCCGFHGCENCPVNLAYNEIFSEDVESFLDDWQDC